MKKVKTTLVIPYAIKQQIADATRRLGVSQSAFISMGCALLLAQVHQIPGPRKRGGLLRELEKEFQKLVNLDIR